MASQDDSQAFRIVYPCIWVYALIGAEEQAMRDVAADVLKGRDYQVEFSRKSAHGNYCAIHVEVTVQDEVERNRLYGAFKSAPAVKMVL